MQPLLVVDLQVKMDCVLRYLAMVKETSYTWERGSVVLKGGIKRLSKNAPALSLRPILVCRQFYCSQSTNRREHTGLREKMCDAAVAVCRSIQYESAGMSGYTLLEH